MPVRLLTQSQRYCRWLLCRPEMESTHNSRDT
jgi:hypothetical protein